MTVLFLKYWKQLAGIFVIGLIMFFIGRTIYSYGYDSASIKYEKQITEYNNQILSKVSDINNKAYNIASVYDRMREDNAKAFKDLKASYKTKELVIYRDGKCDLTTDFIDSFNQAVGGIK